VGDSSGALPVGSELSTCSGSRRFARSRSGQAGGRIYAANTIGAIVGATLFSMLLIPSLGTRGAQQVLIVMSAVSAHRPDTAA